MKRRETIIALFKKYIADEISQEELRELMHYFDHPGNRGDLTALIKAELMRDEAAAHAESVDHLVAGLDEKILGRIHIKEVPKIQSFSEREIRRPWFKKTAIVAASLILFLLAGWWFNRGMRSGSNETETTAIADIKPGTNRATLVIDGSAGLVLDSTQQGVLMDGRQVRYADGTIVASLGTEFPLATLSTPNGGQYGITLPDGTKVWLNAASSLKYPTQFTGNLREVSLTGEGYFEVAKDERRPFVVNSNGQQVQVLGTRFNINAYPDEREVTTTLVAGSVEVVNVRSNTSNLLKPGQQAIIRGSAMDITPVNVSYYTSWKEGRFTFNRAKLPVILRQIERWYDVEFEARIVLEDIPLWGTLSRDVTLSELLETLELNTGYTFKREGRRVTVSQ